MSDTKTDRQHNSKCASLDMRTIDTIRQSDRNAHRHTPKALNKHTLRDTADVKNTDIQHEQMYRLVR